MEENIQMTYTQAITELEELVQKMQDPQCSIDNLSQYTSAASNCLASAAASSLPLTLKSSKSFPTSSNRSRNARYLAGNQKQRIKLYRVECAG